MYPPASFYFMQTVSKEYLDSHVVTLESRGRKCICPTCGGKNLWDTSNENGRVYCFECLSSFHVDEIEYTWEPPVPHPNIEGFRSYYNSIRNVYHGCLEQTHEEYLARRGIDHTIIEQFNIGFCPNARLSTYEDPIAIESGIARRDRMPTLGDRITFPYDGEGKTTDFRGRIYRGNDMKYKGLFSSSVRRGAIYPFNYEKGMALADQKKYLIITEGEIKAILAHMYGFPCVALPGMSSWRPIAVQPDWKVIVMFDNSRIPMHRFRIDCAIRRIYEKLPSIYVATLPLEQENKQDIDSFFLGSGDRVKWFQYILDSSLPFQKYADLRRF